MPEEIGGQGLDPEYETALGRVSLPVLPSEDSLFGIRLGMAVPTLRDHADRGLQRRFIPPALRGDEIWCQLYSEPGAGSARSAGQLGARSRRRLS